MRPIRDPAVAPNRQQGLETGEFPPFEGARPSLAGRAQRPTRPLTPRRRPGGRRCENPTLLNAIAADPDNVEPYLVYADWLCTHDHPHGELIQLMVAEEGNLRARAKIRDAIESLWRTHVGRLSLPAWRALELEWRWGFVHTVSSQVLPVGSAEPDAEDWRSRYFAAVWRAPLLDLRRHPCGRFVRRVRSLGGDFEVGFEGEPVCDVRLTPAA